MAACARLKASPSLLPACHQCLSAYHCCFSLACAILPQCNHVPHRCMTCAALALPSNPPLLGCPCACAPAIRRALPPLAAPCSPPAPPFGRTHSPPLPTRTSTPAGTHSLPYLESQPVDVLRRTSANPQLGASEQWQRGACGWVWVGGGVVAHVRSTCVCVCALRAHVSLRACACARIGRALACACIRACVRSEHLREPPP